MAQPETGTPAPLPSAGVPAAVDIEITTEAGDWAGFPEAPARIEDAVRAALAACGEDVPDPAEVSVSLTDDAHIRVLNREWRGMDKATNVLSFPAADLPDDLIAEGIAQPLGDIIIALETLAAEAVAEHKPRADHLTHLVVHGTLHLMGYDHIEDDEAEEMEGLERQILAGLGIKDPYGPAQDD